MEYSLTPRDDIPCPKCGLAAQHKVGAGKGNHYASLLCQNCGRHIKWLSAYTPEEKAKRNTEGTMMGKPVTEKQLAYLQALGYLGPKPADRLEASMLIEGAIG